MRIAMIGQKGLPAAYGGIERHVEELSVRLANSGHDVLVYARAWFSPKKIKDYRGVRVIHTPTIHTKNLDAIVHTFTATIHALFQKADVIHYHGVGPALLAWIPRMFAPRTKVIVTFHCIDRYHQKWGWFARQMLALGEWAACRFPHETIAVSKTIRTYCLNEYNKLTIYIPNGANLETEFPGTDKLAKMNLAEEKYVLMVSRLIKHKGAHYLIPAWKKARAMAPELLNDYKLAIVGGGVFTDNYVNELEKLAGTDDSIIFTGWKGGETLNQLYAHCKLLVHPSENEGLPLTVMQAMSYARPVLVSDIPEHKEIVPDNRFWFVNAHIESLTEKIVELAADEKALEEAGQKNCQFAAKHFNWNDIARNTEKLYEKIIGEPAAKLKPATV